MKLCVAILFCISINSYAQIIDLDHPTALSIPEIKQKPYERLLKDLNCLPNDLDLSCLKLRKQDTFLLFYSYERFYQDSYVFTYLKKGNSVYGTMYYDKGFNGPLPIANPTCINDLLIALEDTTLRTIDTTIFISHDPNLYFAFYFDNKSVFRAIHYRHSFSSPIISKLIEQFAALPKKLSD